MQRFFRFGSVFFIMLALTQLAAAGQVRNFSSRVCNSSPYVTPTGGDTLPSAWQTITAIATAGLVRCGRVTMQCTVTGTGLYFRNVTGAANCGGGSVNCQCGVAIYDASGQTKIVASSATEACNANSTNHATTGLSAFTLTEGTEYLACYSNSGTTVAFQGNQGASGNVGGTLNVVDGTNKALWNADCTGSGAPNACCTGNGTGNCTGFPASLGTLGAAAGGISVIAYMQVQ